MLHEIYKWMHTMKIKNNKEKMVRYDSKLINAKCLSHDNNKT